MKKSTKIMSIIITIVITLSIAMQASYAVNETNTANTSNNNSNTTNTTGTENDVERANNANLSNLGIRPHDFTGFRYGTTNYEVTVPNDVESVEVYASAQASKATLKGTGTKKLEVGKNSFPVEVTAQDGTKKTYTIHVTREGINDSEENTNTEEPKTTDATDKKETAEGLSELKIANVTLEPVFEPDIYEYTINYTGTEERLEIETKASKETYKVEVTGNYALQEGENLINILVNDAEGKNIATYQLTVNKKAIDEEAEAEKKEEAKKEAMKKMLLIGGGVLIVIIIIIIFIIRHRRNKRYAEEYSVPFSGINGDDIDDYQEEEEIEEPRALKDEYKKKFLDNYNMDEDTYVEEKNSRKKRKGKRFK